MIEELKQALSVLADKVNDLAQKIKAKPDVYFGTVRSLAPGYAYVELDGGTNWPRTAMQCACSVGDRVTVIRKGTSLVTVSTNGTGTTYGGQCYIGAITDAKPTNLALKQLQLVGAAPETFADGTLFTVICAKESSYAGEIYINIVGKGTAGTLYVHNAATSSTNTCTWTTSDTLLLCWYSDRFYLVARG